MYRAIYALPISHTIFFLLIALVLWQLLRTLLSGRRAFRILCAVLFAAWLFTVLELTVLSRSFGTVARVYLMPFRQLKLYLDGENNELLRSFWMNVLLFTPCGFVLPELLPKQLPFAVRLALTLGFALGLSVMAEAAQWYWRLGETECDDIIANTVGALLGMSLTHIADKLCRVAHSLIELSRRR